MHSELRQRRQHTLGSCCWLPISPNTDSTEVTSAELVDISEIPKQSTGVLNLASHSPQRRTTLLHDELPDRSATVVFQGEEPESEIAEWRIPEPGEGDSLDDLWRIQPQDLQCKHKADGNLIKLGSGGAGSVFLGVLLRNTDVAIKVVDSSTPSSSAAS